MDELKKDMNADVAGFFIGLIIYIGAIIFMFAVPISWAWNGLFSADTVGPGIAYGIALLFFIAITFTIIFYGWILVVIGEDW